MDITSVLGASTTTGASASTGKTELGSQDFLKLMIEELVNQDPLDPMRNEELLAQVAQIQNMQTLTNLDKTLSKMTYQNQIATAGSLIGTNVKGVSDAGANVEGVVVKVTAGSTAGVRLVTDLGDSIPIANVTGIEEVLLQW